MNAGAIKQDEFDIETMAAGLIGDRYFLRIVEIDHTTASGIFVPNQSEDKTGWMVGEILGVGNGHRLEADVTVPMFFKVGQRVVCERFSGRRFMIRGKEYAIMNQTSVFGPA